MFAIAAAPRPFVRRDVPVSADSAAARPKRMACTALSSTCLEAMPSVGQVEACTRHTGCETDQRCSTSRAPTSELRVPELPGNLRGP